MERTILAVDGADDQRTRGRSSANCRSAAGVEVGLIPDHIVLDGDPAPLPRKGHSSAPIFGPCLLWLNCWMDQDAIWYGGRPPPRPLCLRWHLAPVENAHSSPHFSAHVYRGQTAGCIRIPLGTEIGLGPGDVVLDGDPVPPRKLDSSSYFSAHFAVARSPISAAAEHFY